MSNVLLKYAKLHVCPLMLREVWKWIERIGLLTITKGQAFVEIRVFQTDWE